jgi:hypothetical protein
MSWQRRRKGWADSIPAPFRIGASIATLAILLMAIFMR